MRALLLIVVALTLGCDETPSRPPVVAATTGPDAPALRGAPLGDDRLPTTHHRIYIANHQSRLEAVEEFVREAPSVGPTHRVELASLLHSRFAYRGDLTDLERASEQVAMAMRQPPVAAETLLLAADIALGLHQFERSAELLGQAEKAGAAKEAIAQLRQELDWSAGRTQRAIASIRQAARDEPGVHTLARVAVLERELGDGRASEAAFEKAEEAITDTNPYTVAWLNFQRGLGILDAGDPKRSLPFLRESVRRLPEYTAAQIHLAEALMLDDATSSEGREIVLKLAERGEPVAMGVLGVGEDEEAKRWRVRATEAFDALVEKHPALAAAHAAEFYASIGELERAADLRKKNAELQPNPWSAQQWAEAELAAGRLDAATNAVAQAAEGSVTPPGLDELRGRICAKGPELPGCKR